MLWRDSQGGGGSGSNGENFIISALLSSRVKIPKGRQPFAADVFPVQMEIIQPGDTLARSG